MVNYNYIICTKLIIFRRHYTNNCAIIFLGVGDSISKYTPARFNNVLFNTNITVFEKINNIKYRL